jgi:hypothetical protein
MPQTVTGDRLTDEMWWGGLLFFEEFRSLCQKHGVGLHTRQVVEGQRATAQAVWQWAPTDTRPAFEIVHS